MKGWERASVGFSPEIRFICFIWLIASSCLPTRTPAIGDTVVGRAVALVPRPDVQAPECRVRAWRVACRGSAGR